MKVGRPLLFNTPQALKRAINTYFKACKAQSRPLTISGLAVHLGTNRQTLLNYQQRGEFFDTIQAAKAHIEAWTEEQLFRKGSVNGVIFNLKNNYGWKDKIEFSGDTPSGELSKEKEQEIQDALESFAASWNNDVDVIDCSAKNEVAVHVLEERDEIEAKIDKIMAKY